MTGIAELYLAARRPHSKEARARLKAVFQKQKYDKTRFVVLSWKRSGSSLLCGILHHHPEITMHNELFNPIDIFTYHPKALVRNKDGDRWTTLGRDLYPDGFLDHIWSGKLADSEALINENFKAVGFKSFPDHWKDVRNEPIWQRAIMDDFRVKKIVLQREDELAVFVSMMRAEKTGRYMTMAYPQNLKLKIDPERFQIFVNNYRDTFRRKYKSPMEKRDTFRVTYEQIVEEENFESEILPLLWDFLGVDNTIPLRKLRETTKQADPDEDLSEVIDNYEELEFCFRHTDVLHFKQQHRHVKSPWNFNEDSTKKDDSDLAEPECLPSWSILLPICSRTKSSVATGTVSSKEHVREKFNSNRLIDLATSSQYDSHNIAPSSLCWELLETFASSLQNTSSESQLKCTECIVGIDVDDEVFNNPGARKRVQSILSPCPVEFVDIPPQMYGRVCKIWNTLGRNAKNDFIVLLGDDIKLIDTNWQVQVVNAFHRIATETTLPFGAACVALSDMSFPGFPTFPVVHRWHLRKFGTILPKQFVNQGGDPYLFELYSRFNAASFVPCRLHNTIGGDGDARYKKHEINWRGQILTLNLMHLQEHLDGVKASGVCLDVVVPSYRTNNNAILKSIIELRATIKVYVRFWLVIDNPDKNHINDVSSLADELNAANVGKDSNYFANVIHYGENRGASFARNHGFNYSSADWVLFLDDDVIPDRNILDAYVGAIFRYPSAKVFVGLTELPPSFNTWTKMLRTCNIMFFYGVANHSIYPAWGVTANLMVRGSRFNPTIQFKNVYPKTGGGEDIDFVFQFKDWYNRQDHIVVGVPGAKAMHPWWNSGETCYRQINGWAWGDSLCITQWPQKTYVTCPNWIEYIVFVVAPISMLFERFQAGLLTMLSVAAVEHLILLTRNFSSAQKNGGSRGWLYTAWVAFGAGTVVSAQEATRTMALIWRLSLFSLCRRVDWNDGQQPKFILDGQLGSCFHFVVNLCVTWLIMFVWKGETVCVIHQ
jgi:LPS sulfotransferase NodH